jgi:gluconolactonase
MSPTLPTQLNETHKITAVPPGGYTPDNIEGPVWIDGWLYMSEIGVRGGQNANSTAQPGRVIRYQPGGSAEPFFGGAEVGTNGLAVDENGFLVAAVQKDGSISRFDLSNPTAPPVPIAAMYNGSRFNSPNDLALRSDGNIYFSDPSYQAPNPLPQAAERAYRVTPSGTVEAITRGNSAEPAELPQLSSPNGVTLSKDENTLYVGHSGGLYKFDVMADGSVANGAAVPDIYGGVDGLGLDCAGNLYVTLHGNGEVIVLSPAGTQLGKITVSSGVTNVAFGGPGRTTLFVTKRNQPELYAVDVGIPGYPY